MGSSHSTSPASTFQPFRGRCMFYSAGQIEVGGSCTQVVGPDTLGALPGDAALGALGSRIFRKIGDRIGNIEQGVKAFEEEQRALLLQVPNLPHDSVPVGKDPSGNKIIREWGKKHKLGGQVLDHVALGERLKILDLERDEGSHAVPIQSIWNVG